MSVPVLRFLVIYMKIAADGHMNVDENMCIRHLAILLQLVTLDIAAVNYIWLRQGSNKETIQVLKSEEMLSGSS